MWIKTFNQGATVKILSAIPKATTGTINAVNVVSERKKKDGLRLGQVRILEALTRNNTLSRVQCAELGKVTLGWAFNFLGSNDKEQCSKTEKRCGFPTLITLGHVRFIEVDVYGDNSKVETRYEITQEGKRAYKSYLNEHPDYHPAPMYVPTVDD